MLPTRLSLPEDPLGTVAAESFGLSYLYPYQRLVISNIVEASPEDERPRHQIVILPTGAGKSLCFQLPALLLSGVTVIVYPLLALIDDQLRRLQERRLNAALLTGRQDRREKRDVLRKVEKGQLSILLTNPETCLSEAVTSLLATSPVSHLVIDEAHCISEWGRTFRPAYLNLHTLVTLLPQAAVTAFTATASPPVLEDIQNLLFGNERAHLIQGNPDRPNISYHVVRTCSRDRAVRHLFSATTARFQNEHNGPAIEYPAIVFAASRSKTEEYARLIAPLLGRDRVCFYHAGLSAELKKSIEGWFAASADGVLCATSAYGMGMDKSNIRTVLHLDLPASVESYLQEAGRAGRDGNQSWAVLISDHAMTAAFVSDANPEADLFTARARQMRAYIQTGGCRRSYLLHLLGVACEGCSGCDRCHGARFAVGGEEAVWRWIARYCHTYPARVARDLLLGTRSPQIMSGGLYACRGFSLARDWRQEEVEQAIACGKLVASGPVTIDRVLSLIRRTGILKRPRLSGRSAGKGSRK